MLPVFRYSDGRAAFDGPRDDHSVPEGIAACVSHFYVQSQRATGLGEFAGGIYGIRFARIRKP